MSLVFTVLIAVLGALYYGCKITGGKIADKAWERDKKARFAYLAELNAALADFDLEQEIARKWNTSEEFRTEAMETVNVVIDSIPEIAGLRMNYKVDHGIRIAGKKKLEETSYANWIFIETVLMARQGKLPGVVFSTLKLWPLYGNWPDGCRGTNDPQVRIALMRWLQEELRRHGHPVTIIYDEKYAINFS